MRPLDWVLAVVLSLQLLGFVVDIMDGAKKEPVYKGAITLISFFWLVMGYLLGRYR